MMLMIYHALMIWWAIGLAFTLHLLHLPTYLQKAAEHGTHAPGLVISYIAYLVAAWVWPYLAWQLWAPVRK